jgi:hypothetical protein
MRALITILIASAALAAAGCGAAGPSDYDKSTLDAISTTQQRLNVLSRRIDANRFDSDADVAAYVRDMRSAAVEFDTLRGTLQRLTPPAEVRDELTGYMAQLVTTAKLARELASAVEDSDAKGAERAETAYIEAGTRLSTLAATRTRVSPISMSTDPSANFMAPGCRRRGRRAAAARPLGRRRDPEGGVMPGF